MSTPSPYRGYWLTVLPDLRTQIRFASEVDVICTEPTVHAAMEVVDAWVENRAR